MQTRRVLAANTRTALFLAAAAHSRSKGRGAELVRDDAILMTVPLDVAWMNQHLFFYPPTIFGVSKHCLALSVSGLRRVLRHLDLIAPYQPSTRHAFSPEWKQLLAQLEHHYAQTALSTFAVWCDQAGITPDGVVAAEHLDAFERFIRTRTIHSEIPRLIRTVCKGWKQAQKILAEWPREAMSAPNRRETYTFSFSDFPQSFQDDVATFERRLAGTDRVSPFRGEGPLRPLRPRSIASRIYNLRQAASALVLLGRNPASITSLKNLVDEGAFKDILTFFWERNIARQEEQEGEATRELSRKSGVSAQTGAIASTLMSVGNRPV